MKNISVIIPTKNRKAFLLRALDSVLKQIRPNDEVIVVDDCSDDSDYNIYDERVSVIKNESPKGGAVSRNIGAELAKNEILMFLDDDDAWEERKIEEQIFLFDDPDTSLVFSGKKVVSDNDLNNPYRVIQPKKKYYSLKDLYECNYIGSTSSVALKRQDFIKHRGFDSNLNCFQDYDLWLRILKEGNAVWDGNTNVIYTVFENSGMQVSRSLDGRHPRAAKYLIDKYCSELSSKNQKELRANLYQLVSKAMMQTNPKKSLNFAIKAAKTNFNIRSIKFLLASTLSVIGVSYGKF